MINCSGFQSSGENNIFYFFVVWIKHMAVVTNADSYFKLDIIQKNGGLEVNTGYNWIKLVSFYVSL